MTVSDAAWERIRANPSAPRASFLSMLDWKEQWIDGEKFPFTPSVVDMHGIEACVDVVLAEGLDASIARHELCGRACARRRARHGPRALAAQRGDHGGLRHGHRRARTGSTDIQVRAHCRERYGVMISGGQGAGNLVRIGHMGPTARSLYPVVGLLAVGRTFADLGRPGEARGWRSRPRWRCSRRQRPSRHDAAALRAPPPALARGGDGARRPLRRGRCVLLRRHRAAAAAQARLRLLRAPRRHQGHRGAAAACARRTARSWSAPPSRTASSSARQLVHERLPALARDGARASPTSASARWARSEATSASRIPHSDPATFLLAVDAEVECRRGGGQARRLADRRLRRRAVPDQPRAGRAAHRGADPRASARARAVAHAKFSFHERPTATVACLARVVDGVLAEARVAVGSVGARPVRSRAAEEALRRDARRRARRRRAVDGG